MEAVKATSDVPGRVSAMRRAWLEASAGESALRRWMLGLAALTVVALMAYALAGYWVPAHSGVDQNGYLYGGRTLLDRFTAGFQPTHPRTGAIDPYQFVGRMWIGVDLETPAERFYPKYPQGVPAIVALLIKLTGLETGVTLSYLISPVSTVLAIGLTFLLVRMFAGSFLAFIATVVVACSPVTLELANNPNSHALDLFCVTAGMWLMFAWWKSQPGLLSTLRAFPAGVFLGYALTVRYTEGLLLLPMALVALDMLWTHRKRALLPAALLFTGWAIPVGSQVAYNLASFGAVTGYDPTSESTGFSWDYFLDNWPTMLGQMHGLTAMVFFPLALAGLVAMFWWSWRLALVMVAWVLPTVLIYTAYYWAPDGMTIGYGRFYLTILPALAGCAVWFLPQIAAIHVHGHPRRSWRRSGWIIAAGLLTVANAVIGLNIALPHMDQDTANRLLLVDARYAIERYAPPGSVIISREDRLLHQWQFSSNYLLYNPSLFNVGTIGNLMKNVDPDEPQPWQLQRREELYHRLSGFDQPQLDRLWESLIRDAFLAGRRVFLVVPDPMNPHYTRPVPKPQRPRDRRPIAGRPFNDLPPALGTVVEIGGWGTATLRDDRWNPTRPRPVRRVAFTPPRLDSRSINYIVYELLPDPRP